MKAMKRFTCFAGGPLPSNRFVTADGIGKGRPQTPYLARGSVFRLTRCLWASAAALLVETEVLEESVLMRERWPFFFHKFMR